MWACTMQAAAPSAASPVVEKVSPAMVASICVWKPTAGLEQEARKLRQMNS